MSINVAGKLSKLMNRKCPSCKGPLGNTVGGWSVCEVCMTKRCSVCSKISIHGVRLTPSGKPLCPRHWSALIRMQSGIASNYWSADKELQVWMDQYRLEVSNKMEKQLDIPDEVITAAQEIPEETRQTLIDSLTDEQREFIKSLKGDK